MCGRNEPLRSRSPCSSAQRLRATGHRPRPPLRTWACRCSRWTSCVRWQGPSHASAVEDCRGSERCAPVASCAAANLLLAPLRGFWFDWPMTATGSMGAPRRKMGMGAPPRTPARTLVLLRWAQTRPCVSGYSARAGRPLGIPRRGLLGVFQSGHDVGTVLPRRDPPEPRPRYPRARADHGAQATQANVVALGCVLEYPCVFQTVILSTRP